MVCPMWNRGTKNGTRASMMDLGPLSLTRLASVGGSYGLDSHCISRGRASARRRAMTADALLLPLPVSVNGVASWSILGEATLGPHSD